MRIASNVSFMLTAALFGGCVLGSSDQTDDSTVAVARLAGAIFTTTVNGSRVDANIYVSKDAVYLDGGPGNGAPAKAASLPEGDYYFQVTDPSGKILLSTDALQCRRFHVSSAGLINAVLGGGCAHATGVDQDHGALTVQLMPYLDTPNPGGEYKAWVTPVGEFDSSRHTFHGFVESESKTDNYKVRNIVVAPPPYCGDGHVDAGEECDGGDNCTANCTIIPPPPPPPCCGDGHTDAGEQCDDGNTVDGDGCSSTCQTEVICNAPSISVD